MAEYRMARLRKVWRWVAMVMLVFGARTFAFQVDSLKIKTDYQNGDFDKIESALGPFLSPGVVCAHNDSVTALKFLAVVYAARPATREKGRYCMLRLLDVDPTVDLIDLFVGEEVGDIFERARREHELNPNLNLRSEKAVVVSVDSASPAKTEAEAEVDTSARDHASPWVVSALAAAAVAGMAWYSFENSPHTP